MRLTWAEEMLDDLPRKLAERLSYFRSLSNNFLEIMDFIEPWNAARYPSVEAGLERIAALAAEEFIEGMIGPRFHRRQIEAWMQGRVDEIFEQLTPEHRELIRHPLAKKREFLQLCYDYLPYFQKEERRIEPWLIRAVHESQEQLAKDGVGFLSNIHPRMHVHEKFVQFHKAKTYQFAYQELQHIYLYPSTFADPHLLLGTYGERICVVISVQVPGFTQKMAVPNDFIAKMKVFSDPTRAAILKSLLQHPYCIQQLAELHGVSEPAVAKHMKLLTDAQFVWGERKGRYVFYRADPGRLEKLSVDIHEFIDMPDPTIPERRK